MFNHALTSWRSATNLLSFSRLTTVTVGGHVNFGFGGYEHPLDLSRDEVLHLFYLPNLSELNVAMPNHRTKWHRRTGSFLSSSWPLPEPPAAIRLETLRLVQSPAPAEMLEFILKQTPNLTRLEYGCYKPDRARDLDFNILAQALSYVRNTLATLVIRYDIFATWAADPESAVRVCKGTLGSLHDFKSLTSP